MNFPSVLFSGTSPYWGEAISSILNFVGVIVYRIRFLIAQDQGRCKLNRDTPPGAGASRFPGSTVDELLTNLHKQLTYAKDALHKNAWSGT